MNKHSFFIDSVRTQAKHYPDRIAFENSAGERLTYAELMKSSDSFAHWLANPENILPGTPVVLFGHKSPHMLVGMCACAKAGHPYAPIDTIFPAGRVNAIVAQLIDEAGSALFVNTTEGTFVQETIPVLNREDLNRICSAHISEEEIDALPGMDPDDVFYILFTSGSTGTPKGVEMPQRYVDYFTRWLIDDYRSLATEEERSKGLVWFNRSPFTFDLSTDDLFCGLSSGDCVFALEETAEASFSATFSALASSDVTDWISTPSFADSCLVDPHFNESLLPHLRRIMLAGETLRKDTVSKLHERFPQAKVLNNYGPTETGTVTICEITDEMMRDQRSLPIGYLGPEVEGVLLDHQTLEPVADGTPGELFIVGNVARGYWGRPDLTAAGFRACPDSITKGKGSYRTGDECIMGEGGLLYYNGRLDGMLKLHGYRIEIGEIESVLSDLPEIDMVCVLPKRTSEGTVSKLVAVVKPSSTCIERGLKLTRTIKKRVKSVLPAYMIPSTFKYVDAFPLNPNGKADRKTLAQMVGV